VAHTEVDERLADLAVEHGYADQAHLTSESRRLTGLPPATFIAEMRESCASHDHRASLHTWLAAGRASALTPGEEGRVNLARQPRADAVPMRGGRERRRLRGHAAASS
jgi:AraC-like DNA-binding protein